MYLLNSIFEILQLLLRFENQWQLGKLVHFSTHGLIENRYHHSSEENIELTLINNHFHHYPLHQTFSGWSRPFAGRLPEIIVPTSCCDTQSATFLQSLFRPCVPQIIVRQRRFIFNYVRHLIFIGKFDDLATSPEAFFFLPAASRSRTGWHRH